MKRLTTQGPHLRDALGRHVILSGINLINKGENQSGYIANWSPEIFQDLHAWGFNVLRFGIIWDAIEPQPGNYDESYLVWIEHILDLAAAHDLSVFLDMHQDLFSALYSDGAPAWATLGKDQPHVDEALWSDAYLSSDAVKQSFDHFWNDAPAADGVGVQTRFGNCWRMLAARFGHHPAVIGYDLLNEPFPGTQGDTIYGALMGGVAMTLADDDSESTAEDAMAAFTDPYQREHVLTLLNDASAHAAIANAAAEPLAAFDAGLYAQFVARMVHTIREFDSESLIFIGNSYFSNMGVPSAIDLVRDHTGNPLPNQVFAPHGYDLVVDTEAMQRASDNRIDFILQQHKATQERLGCPVLFGEWGGHTHYPDGLGHLRHIMDRFEEYLWSHTYWSYQDGMFSWPIASVLPRPYPEATIGMVLQYRSTPTSLEMRWDEGACVEGESIIRLPWSANQTRIVLDGEHAPAVAGEEHCVTIPAEGGQRKVRLEKTTSL